MTEETYEKYMQRLTDEMDYYRRDMIVKSPSTVYDEAQHIVNMAYADSYLRSNEIPDDELEYVMKAKRPLHEIAMVKEAYDSVERQQNPVAKTVLASVTSSCLTTLTWRKPQIASRSASTERYPLAARLKTSPDMARTTALTSA